MGGTCSGKGQEIPNSELVIVENIGETLLQKSKFQQHLKQCKQKKIKFTDPDFPPNFSSLQYTYSNRKIVWKRVTQIITNPVMVENQIQPKDVQQGNVGDCYFLAAISSIAEESKRIKKIFFDQMEIREQGIYRFSVARQGRSTEVFIDDYIPVFEGTNRPVFCKPNNNQIWVVLLEKLWAKLSGSYNQTSKGYPHEVFNTLLLAPCYYEEIKSPRINQQSQSLWEKLWQGHQKNFPMCAGSRPENVCKGIKSGHTYSLLKCFQVKEGNTHHKLIQLRNPWGNTEYTGRFSECDRQFWDSPGNEVLKRKLGLEQENDGIFYISLEQFIRNFQCVDISHDMPEYGYYFTNLQANSHEENYFEIQVNNDVNKPVYITLEKAFDRHLIIDKKQSGYGYNKILITRATRNQDQIKYEYVNSKMEDNFPDLTLQLMNLKKGRYIILCQTQFPNKLKGSFTLSTYSPSTILEQKSIKQIEKPDKYFLQKAFQYHAYVINDKRNQILNSQDDWTSMMYFPESGYGYVCINIGYNSQLKIIAKCDTERIYQNGFTILEENIKRHQGIIAFQLEKNEQKIIIFAVNNHEEYQNLSFPPNGFKIQSII